MTRTVRKGIEEPLMKLSVTTDARSKPAKNPTGLKDH